MAREVVLRSAHAPGATAMRTTRTTAGRLRWFADRPIAVKLGAVVALMGAVGLLIAVLAVQGAQHLRDGEQRLYTEVVQPMDTLGALQRSFQGDRVRIIAYGISDVATRATLREDLAKRQGDLQGLVGEYDGAQADDAAWAALQEGLTGYYAATGQRLDAIDARTAPALGFAEEKPLATAVMEPYAAESDAQAGVAAEEAA